MASTLNGKTDLSKNSVDSMSARDRLWDSLNYTYGEKAKKIGAEYDKLASQVNNQLLSKGMQRSSFGLQTYANVGKQKMDALSDNNNALIADYENRLYQLERDEKADDQWERQFAAGREDTLWNQNFQTSQFEYSKLRDIVADQQWQKQYDEQLRQFNENMAFQKERANVSDAQWQKEYEEKLRQFNESMAEQKRQFDLEYSLKNMPTTISGVGGPSIPAPASNPNNNGTNLSQFWLDAKSTTAAAATAAANTAKNAFADLSAALNTASKAQQQAQKLQNKKIQMN